MLKVGVLHKGVTAALRYSRAFPIGDSGTDEEQDAKYATVGFGDEESQVADKLPSCMYCFCYKDEYHEEGKVPAMLLNLGVAVAAD